MGFFNNKQEVKKVELPSLPGLPSLPELPNLDNKTSNQPIPKNNIQSYPEFQRSPTNQTGLQAIKNSVTDNFEVHQVAPEEKRTVELSEVPEYTSSLKRNISKEPLFIKIDKFQEAVEKFEEIKKKVSDIEDSLDKIKDLKDREDQELKAWEEEIKLIKDKVANIDTALFSKI